MGCSRWLTERIRARLVFTGALTMLICLVCAGRAAAAISGSAITSPASGTELFYNGDTGSGSVTVRGTVSGQTSTSRGDLLCYFAADTSWDTVATGIDVSSGSFAVNVSLQPIAGFVCRLAMVPAGTTPSGQAAAAFTGPSLSVTRTSTHSANGNVYGYDALVGPLPWSFQLESLGECPVFSSFATDPTELGSFQLFAGNACLPQSSGIPPSLQSRSALQIDGLNAYPPGAIGATAAQGGGLTGEPGFEPLSYSTSFNPSHDAVTITENDGLMICDAPGGFPPTPANCPSLHDSGVQVQQSTTLLAGGVVARLSQRFASSDGKAHTVDALFTQSVAASTGGVPGFQFPAQESLATHATPDSFSQFPPGPSSIFVIANSAAAPATSNPVGAITYSRPPLAAYFLSASGSQSATFAMRYTDTIPAGGAVTYDWSFAQASSVGSLAALERVERDRFLTPAVVIRQPRNHALLRQASTIVKGVASDTVGLSSVTVNGTTAGVGAGGAFSAHVRLRQGANTITAKAANLAGNVATATVVVRYVPFKCTVPKLRGKTLAAAKKALRKAHCAVGKVKRIHTSRVRKGRVISTRPKAKSKHKLGTKVELTVSRGP